jgi:hypothetical protein
MGSSELVPAPVAAVSFDPFDLKYGLASWALHPSSRFGALGAEAGLPDYGHGLVILPEARRILREHSLVDEQIERASHGGVHGIDGIGDQLKPEPEIGDVTGELAVELLLLLA